MVKFVVMASILGFSAGAFASPQIVEKMKGQYSPAPDCTFSSVMGKLYSEFSAQTEPDYSEPSQEFFYLKPRQADGTWDLPLINIKLADVGKTVYVANGGQAYYSFIKRTVDGFEVYSKPCALGSCRSWQQDGSIKLLANGNLAVVEQRQPTDAPGRSCVLMRK